MRIVKCEQGTDEWDALRRCRITASRIGDVMAKPGTKAHDGYMREITLELLGHVGAEESPEWFRHGREMEPRALSRYSWKHNQELDRNVFLIHDQYDWLGASPDSLVVVDGQYTEGVEVKSRLLYKNYREAIQRAKKYASEGDLTRACDPVYRWQLQASMWITGWNYWFFVNYYEHKDGSWRLGRCPIPRDDACIAQIEARCVEFMYNCYENACLPIRGTK